MRAYQFIVVLSLTAVLAACDRRGSTSADNASPPTAGAPQPPPGPTLAERYATYRVNVQPVVDELTAVQAMPENPATLTFANLDARVQALTAANARLAWKVSDEDKRRESYQDLVVALAATVEAHRCWKEQNSDNEIAATNPDVVRRSQAVIRAVDLDTAVNKSLTTAYVNIWGMNTALKQGK